MTGGHVLSNGRYRVLVTAAGAGYSSLGETLLTRWTADPTREAEGWFLYVKDLDTGRCWSAGHQPAQRTPDAYQARSSEGLVMLAREDADIALVTEIAVDSLRDIEWRRHTVTNRSDFTRRLSLTTCIEVVLDSPGAAAGHPAFSKLFVQTEHLPEHRALLARRRPRSPHDPALGLGHALLGKAVLEWETDRTRFVGRGGSLREPIAMRQEGELSGTTGNVLDPLLSLRCVLTLDPGESVRIDTLLAAGIDRETVLGLLRSAAAGAPDSVFPASRQLGPLVGLPAPVRHRFHPAPGVDAEATGREPLAFFNGFGGFTGTGDEYVIRLDRTADGIRLPPLPWCNVVANADVGFVSSERGLGFTWSANSRENRLTTWFNDPVSDPAAESLHIRDEEAGLFWSPTPGPTPGSGAYEVRHGFGYTTWRHASRGLEQEATTFVPVEDPVKLVRLRITNRGLTARHLSIFYFAEWVLGGMRAETMADVVTESAEDGRLLLARNPGSVDFGTRVAFAAASSSIESDHHFTADREAFLGRFGSTEAPEAIGSVDRLDGRAGRGLDPCVAFQLRGELAPGATGEWIFLLGQVDHAAEAAALAARFRSPESIDEALTRVRAFWTGLLSAVQIETPQRAMDLMVNGWLSYQNLSCRMWARSAFYQSGGAFGYRDQLQDAAALVYHRPDITRSQIVLHAGRQFVEGDVLHWWHPPAGRGIRTRFSDDLLWLPFVTEFYVTTTGDKAVLDEQAGFLLAPPVPDGEDEVFLEPTDARAPASVYEHCCRAIDRSLTRGEHGLPLMGTGDWNDGMNRVGRLGRGESVWLGFFLFTILEKFLPVCRVRQDHARVSRYADYLAALGVALNAGGWDGEWYRRAYYDDGTPLGSSGNDECRIDAIAQSWSVLSGAAPPDRAERALDAMERFLVDEPARLIRLLTPPFDRTPHDPGYIKGYVPGVRENGGQYTHAALWAVRALAEAGRGDRAAPLFGLLNPVSHGDSPEKIAVYQGEPYVIAADVYGTAPHLGRAGWTWYTGSAGWMFRVALESVLGVTIRHGTTLAISPCIPSDWPGFTVTYGLPDGRTRYVVAVTRSGGLTGARSEGLLVRVEAGAVLVELRSDGGTHRVDVELGPDVGPRYRPAPSTSP